MGRKIILKKEIPEGVLITDLYDDGNFYYLINGQWIPIDFNDFKHSDYCEELEIEYDKN